MTTPNTEPTGPLADALRALIASLESTDLLDGGVTCARIEEEAVSSVPATPCPDEDAYIGPEGETDWRGLYLFENRRAGLALAHAAWQEGASAMLRSTNQHEEGAAWHRPVSPYGAPLLALITAAKEATR